MQALALMYEHGKGVQKNEGEAVRLYRLSAEQGHPGAQFNLATMYEHGRGGLQKDVLMAISLYHKAKFHHSPSTLKSYITFTNAESKKRKPEISEDDFLADFYPKTKVLIVDMCEQSLFHTQGSSIIEHPENSFSMNLLYAHYKNIVDAGQDLDYWATTIAGAHHPGFFITCMKPKKRLLNEYREDSEDEKTGFCRVKVGKKFYYCIGGSNPKLGYKLKIFLSKKGNLLSELKELKDKLLGSKQDFEHRTKTHPSLKPQLVQIEGELALLPKAHKAIEKGFSDLTNLINQNVGIRNKAFREANEELFK